MPLRICWSWRRPCTTTAGVPHRPAMRRRLNAHHLRCPCGRRNSFRCGAARRRQMAGSTANLATSPSAMDGCGCEGAREAPQRPALDVGDPGLHAHPMIGWACRSPQRRCRATPWSSLDHDPPEGWFYVEVDSGNGEDFPSSASLGPTTNDSAHVLATLMASLSRRFVRSLSSEALGYCWGFGSGNGTRGRVVKRKPRKPRKGRSLRARHVAQRSL